MLKPKLNDDHQASPRYQAIVLGGASKSRLEQDLGPKALMPFQGKPLVSYIVSALKACPEIARVIYVGPTDAMLAGYFDAGDEVIKPQENFASNLALAFAASAGQACLISTNDIPFMSANHISHFIHSAPEADFVYPIVSKFICEQEFPQLKRTYARLKDGQFTGGNMILCQASQQSTLHKFAARAYAARKSPLAMASLLGFKTIMQLLLAQLTISELERRISKMMGLSAKAWISPSAAVASDIDGLEHFHQLQSPQAS